MTDLKAVTQVEMFISATKLPNKDTFSKSDPFCVVELQDVKDQTWKVVGTSEVIQDNLSPEFQKNFVVDYFFEEHQKLRVTFLDCDSKSNVSDLKKHDYLGHADFLLADLVAAPGQTLHIPCLSKKDKAIKKDCIVTIRGEETSSSKDLLKITFRAEKLDKKDLFGKSDPL
jgi:Ca2+-dependent lipid-binding protein